MGQTGAKAVKRHLLALCAMLSALASACKPAATTPSARVRVVATIAPLAGLVRPLLPEGCELAVLLPPGRSEHGYEFSAQDLTTLGSADVVVLVGLGLDAKVSEFLKEHPSRTRQEVNCGASLGTERPPDDDHAKVAPGTPHDHRADEHKHGVDPHVWLDPVLVLELVPAIRSAIQSATALRGEPRAEELETKEADMLARVREVDQAYRTRLAPLAGRAIVTHHAAFDRLADRYGLRIAAVIREVESGEPTPGAIAHVVEAIRKESVPAIFVEPQFDASVGARIAREAGVELGHLDPLGNGDWFAMMHANLAEIVRAFGATSKEKP